MPGIRGTGIRASLSGPVLPIFVGPRRLAPHLAGSSATVSKHGCAI